MVLNPAVYADLLGKKIAQHKSRVWLVNTGWSGGPYGVGSRMKLPYTRAMITAALGGITSPSDTMTATAAALTSIAVAPLNPSVAEGLTEQFTDTVRERVPAEHDRFLCTAATLE